MLTAAGTTGDRRTTTAKGPQGRSRTRSQSRNAFAALVQREDMVDVHDPLDAVAGPGVKPAHFARQTACGGADGVLLGGHQLAVAFVSVVQLVEGAAL